MIRTFFRHLLESIKSLKRNGWMTIASLSAVTITLTLVGIFLGVILNATKLAEDIRENVDVSVFVDIGTEQEDMDALEQSLNDLPNVSEVKFSSRDEELQKIQDAMGDSWNLFEGDSNPLYNVFVVSATDPEYTTEIAEQAGELPNVFKADYGGDSSDRIFELSAAVRTWGLAAAVLLIFVAMFLISNTIRITILSRQREIQIMRLVGAKNGYIRWPFFLEGGWIGLLGSIILTAFKLQFNCTKYVSITSLRCDGTDWDRDRFTWFCLINAPFLKILNRCFLKVDRQDRLFLFHHSVSLL